MRLSFSHCVFVTLLSFCPLLCCSFIFFFLYLTHYDSGPTFQYMCVATQIESIVASHPDANHKIIYAHITFFLCAVVIAFIRSFLFSISAQNPANKSNSKQQQYFAQFSDLIINSKLFVILLLFDGILFYFNVHRKKLNEINGIMQKNSKH